MTRFSMSGPESSVKWRCAHAALMGQGTPFPFRKFGPVRKNRRPSTGETVEPVGPPVNRGVIYHGGPPCRCSSTGSERGIPIAEVANSTFVICSNISYSKICMVCRGLRNREGYEVCQAVFVNDAKKEMKTFFGLLEV